MLQLSASNRHLEPLLSEGCRERWRRSAREKRRTRWDCSGVPALNFEALWLHGEGGSEDLLVPLHTVRGLERYEPVSFGEAMSVLKAAARPLLQMDDTMGA